MQMPYYKLTHWWVCVGNLQSSHRSLSRGNLTWSHNPSSPTWHVCTRLLKQGQQLHSSSCCLGADRSLISIGWTQRCAQYCLCHALSLLIESSLHRGKFPSVNALEMLEKDFWTKSNQLLRVGARENLIPPCYLCWRPDRVQRLLTTAV